MILGVYVQKSTLYSHVCNMAVMHVEPGSGKSTLCSLKYCMWSGAENRYCNMGDVELMRFWMWSACRKSTLKSHGRTTCIWKLISEFMSFLQAQGYCFYHVNCNVVWCVNFWQPKMLYSLIHECISRGYLKYIKKIKTVLYAYLYCILITMFIVMMIITAMIWIITFSCLYFIHHCEPLYQCAATLERILSNGPLHNIRVWKSVHSGCRFEYQCSLGLIRIVTFSQRLES